jgi:DNA-binding response OmpR family regulator
MRALGALEHDPRVELYVADALTPDWRSFARRVAGVIALTESEPLHALGYVVTAEIRCPIVVAVSRRNQGDVSDVLEAGAAALVTTPLTAADVDRVLPIFSAHATPARMDGALRFLLDPISRVVRYRSKVARLSLREFALLHCLTEQHGRPVSADAIMRYVWGDTEVGDGSRKILDVYVFQLRRKLKTIGIPNAIFTVRGFGYALSAAEAREQNA